MTPDPLTIDENSDDKGTSNGSDRRTASWDLKNAVGNYSTLVITQIASAAFSFASVWVATRYLGVDGYGGIVAILAGSQVAQIFVNWTCSSLARYGVQEFVETGEITKSFWSRTLIFLPNTLAFIALSSIWLPVVSKWLKLPSETGFYLIVHFLVMALWLHIQHAIQGVKLPKLQGVLLAIERGIIFAILVGLELSGFLTYLTAIVAFIAGPLTMSFVGLIRIRKLFSWRFRVDTDWTMQMLKFSVPLVPFSLVGFFSTNYLDAIFISQYLSISDLGVYSVLFQINGILMQFPALAGSLLMPLFVTLFATERSATVRKYITDVLPFLTVLWSLSCLVLVSLITLLLPFIFGAEFDSAGGILFILSISAISTFVALAGYSPLMSSRSLTYLSSLLAMLIAGCNVLFNFLLIPKYGLKGCAWSTSLSYLITIAVMVTILHRRGEAEHKWVLQSVIPIVVFVVSLEIMGDLLLSAIVSIFVVGFFLLRYRKSVFVSGKVIGQLLHRRIS